MNSTLSREASQKVFELVGEYKTEDHHLIDGPVNEYGAPIGEILIRIPRPNFAEVIRILPKIGEAIQAKHEHEIYPVFQLTKHARKLLSFYMFIPTEEEGMRAVEEYLMKLI